MKESPHRRFERLLAAGLTAKDPVAALRKMALDPRLTPELRSAARQADPDGVLLSALLISRLRFERLIRGCPEAEQSYDLDPAAFATLFRRYHLEEPPGGTFPAQEAQQFRRWLGRTARGQDFRLRLRS